jgi:hypothetical protein
VGVTVPLCCGVQAECTRTAAVQRRVEGRPRVPGTRPPRSSRWTRCPQPEPGRACPHTWEEEEEGVRGGGGGAGGGARGSGGRGVDSTHQSTNSQPGAQVAVAPPPLPAKTHRALHTRTHTSAPGRHYQTSTTKRGKPHPTPNTPSITLTPHPNTGNAPCPQAPLVRGLLLGRVVVEDVPVPALWRAGPDVCRHKAPVPSRG